MKLIKNTGTDRVIDVLRQTVQSGASLDIASPALSLFAFFELRDLLNHAAHSRLILPLDADGDLTLLGSAADRAARNRLQARWLARECAKWIREKTEVRASSSLLPQSAYLHPASRSWPEAGLLLEIAPSRPMVWALLRAISSA